MSDYIEEETIKAVQKLYRTNANAKKLFDLTAGLKNDASETNIERMMSVIAVDRSSAIRLARELEGAGIGRFVTGRRGAQSRFVWKHSRVALGQAAKGAGDGSASVTEASIEHVSADVAVEGKPLTIASAKFLLAKSLGVLPEQIEITVTA